MVKEKVKALVCVGTDNQKLFDFFGDKIAVIKDTHSMAEAVAEAQKLANVGDVVLLSPACASFDLFENGITRALVLDYRDFRMTGELVKLDLMPLSPCAK